MDGAGAAMLSIDKQQRPPETRGIDTPHSTRGYTQRVVVAMQSSAVGPWAGVADDDLAALVEPRLNAWLAAILGDPANYVFGAHVFNAVFDTDDPTKIASWSDSGVALEVGLSELGLSPLALVLGSESQRGGGQSEVQERIGAALSAKARARPGAVPEHEAIVLQADSPEAGKTGLVAFESFAWLLRTADREVEAAAPDGHGARRGRHRDRGHAERRRVRRRRRRRISRAAWAWRKRRRKPRSPRSSAAIAAVPADDEAIAALDPAAPATVAMLNALHAALAQARELGWRSALPSERVSAGASGASDVQGERVEAR